jgi:hypothetical protein
MGILTFYGTKKKHKKFPCMHGNINFLWNKIKDKEKFPHVFHKQLYLHGISLKGWWFKSHLQHFLYPCIQTILEGGEMSTEGETMDGEAYLRRE